MPDAVAPAVPHAATRLRPASLGDFTITDGFWADQQEVNRTSVIPHCDASLEKVGWIENFRAASRGTLAEDRVGRLFTDSEIYKTMEAMAWENTRRPSEHWDRRLAELTEVVRSAQSSDGYLNTFYGYEGGPDRYSDFEWGHELYCDGHLFQAAVAIARAGGPEEFLEVSRRLADHIVAEFADGNREMLCGHPEVETALVELYRTVGDERYLELARLFVERRGHRVLADTMFKGRDYYQDNVPVRDAEVLVGHSVRALYLAAGAIDVAVETGDDELLDAVRRQYDRTLERRTYLTGGMGSNHHGETYGDDWELPSERAYAETCAAIASVHVAWRLLLATGEERYADVIERTLYNSVISSPSVDGTEFFYVNALQRRAPGIDPEPGVPSLRRTDGRRASWFTTSCCPTNYARTLASLDAYLATTDHEGVQLHQYAAGDVRLEFGGRTVALRVDTDYPRSGTVTVRVVESDGDPWTLGIRVPDWARSAVIGTPDGEEEHRAGLASTRRAWRVGDVLTLRLDVAPRWVYPDPRIDDIRGTVALARGPLVYALEAVDGIGSDGERLDLDSITVDTSVAPRDIDTDLGIPDIVAVEVSARVRRTLPAAPYLADPAGPPVDDARPLAALPYFRWANRGPSTMRVWLPRTDVAVVEAGR